MFTTGVSCRVQGAGCKVFHDVGYLRVQDLLLRGSLGQRTATGHSHREVKVQPGVREVREVMLCLPFDFGPS